MTTISVQAESAEESGGEWDVLFEDLLRGLVHAMNNRLTAMSAFAELAAMDDEDLELDLLQKEISRMHTASSLVGLLVSRAGPEALEVRPVLDLALEVHAHHPRMRTIACEIEEPSDTMPVRVPRWALLRVLLLLIDVAKREGEQRRLATVPIRITSDDDMVRVHIATKAVASAEALRLAAVCGGKLETVGEEQVFELLSLPAQRRRERAG
jgi:hypothetical protein